MLRLPDIFVFSGDWPEYEEKLYSFFRNDFFASVLTFNGLKVITIKEPRSKGKEAGFWHITSQGKEENERTPDFKKCERIRWIRPIIENYKDSSIKVWKVQRKRQTRICLCYGDWEYVVILIKKRKYYLLLTAYPIEREHRRRKLQKEYKKYKEYQKTKTASLRDGSVTPSTHGG